MEKPRRDGKREKRRRGVIATDARARHGIRRLDRAHRTNRRVAIGAGWARQALSNWGRYDPAGLSDDEIDAPVRAA